MTAADETAVENPKVKPPRQSAAGVPPVMHALEYSLEQTSLWRTAINLLNINQTNGIDCPGCAWPEPEPGKRHTNEYCENGAKHINDEATTRRITRKFFREHPISELAAKSDMWLNEQGRLTEPMVIGPVRTTTSPSAGTTRSTCWQPNCADSIRPTRRCSALPAGSASRRRSCCSCSRGPSAPTIWPDCSNMCHESSGAGLNETLGGQGQREPGRPAQADLVLAVGLNPGSNMPSMLSALEETKRNGGHVIAVNPLPEAGLIRFKNPQKVSGILGRETTIADQFLHIKPGGTWRCFRRSMRCF